MNNYKECRLCAPFVTSFLDYPENEHCVSMYFTGCSFDCNGCQNKVIRDPEYNVWTRDMSAKDIMDTLCFEYERHRTKKVCLMGGDPLFHANIEITKELLKINNFFEICLYTGNDVEFIKENDIKGFTYLKTGKYFENLLQLSEKNDKYFQLSSTNQKIYDKDLNLLSKDGRIEF